MKTSFVCPICGLEWKPTRWTSQGICMTCLRYSTAHRRLYGPNASGAVRFIRACTETEAYYRKHCLGGYTVLDWLQWSSWLAAPAKKPLEQERKAV